MKTNLNDYIKKSHVKAVEKFNDELKAWAKETGEKEPTLYEDAYISFTLSDITVEHGKMFFRYDGRPDSVTVVDTWFFLPGGIKATKKRAVWTAEGQQFIHRRLARIGIVPTSEQTSLFNFN